MLDKLLVWLLARSWATVGKTIEQRDLVYNALQQCYKNQYLNQTWENFTQAILAWLEDAKMEVIAARKWGQK